MPPTGFIEPINRTPDQANAHQLALAQMKMFTLAPVTLPAGGKVMLTKFLDDADVIQDMGLGFAFPGFHQLTGSCFPAGTPVRMSDGGEKPIESVVKGDQVITHTGTARYVCQTMRRIYTGEMFKIHVSGFPFPLEMTDDHQVAISVDGGIQWRRADELEEGNKVLVGWDRRNKGCLPLDTSELLGSKCIVLDELMKDDAYTKGNEPDVPNNNVPSARYMVKRSGIDWRGKVRLHRSRVENSIFRNVPVCPSLGRFVGLYLAEGGCDEGRVVFTFHVKERDTLAAEVIALARGLFGAEGEFETREKFPNTIKVRFQNQNLAEVLKSLIPGNVYTKRVPGLFFEADENTRLSLLLGWLAGDGYVGVKGGKRPGAVRITGVTVCAELARDMTTIALSCGLRATCGVRKARGHSKVSYGVDLAGKKAVSLFPAVSHFAGGVGFRKEDKGFTNFGYARTIRRIDHRWVDSLPVYDFEVEEDHSFIAGGIVVHNCVGAASGNAQATLSAIQRKIADNPTKAFVPWWPYAYGRTRFNEGDRGQGEGAVSSVMGKTLDLEGTFAQTEVPGLPAWNTSDGLSLTQNIEYQWSDGGSNLVSQHIPLGQTHTTVAMAPVYTPDDIETAIVNGYPVLNGCAYYVGNGAIKGTGDTAYVRGSYNGRGGHETGFYGVWMHPNDGRLFLYWNQWPASTYPKDPAGGPRCSVWVPESEVVRMLNAGWNGIEKGEAFAISHLDYFPAQADKIINWSQM